MLAAGATWQQSADAVGRDISTIGRWQKRRGWPELQGLYEARIADALDSRINEAMREMMVLWICMVRGEVSADDKRIDRIQRTVERYLAGAFTFEDAAADSAASARASMAVQVNVGDTSARALPPGGATAG